MPWPLTALFVTGALLLTLISATLSFLFCHSLGGGPLEGGAYGTAAAAIDVLKALAPFALAQAVRQRQWGRGLAAVLLWVIAVTVSMSSAIGLAAQNRLGKAGAVESLQAEFKDTREELADTARRLASLGPARPASEVEALLQAALRQPVPAGRRVRSVAALSANCERAERATAAPCAEVGRLRGELARAGERERLEAHMTALRGRLERLRGAGAGEGSEADRQAGVILRLLAVAAGISASLPAVQTGLIALMALAIEVASTCSLYAALGSHALGHARSREEEHGQAASGESGPLPGTVAGYCEARLRSQEGARLAMRQIHQDYEAWCYGSNRTPLQRGEFLRALRREGEDRGWSMAGGVIHGIELRADAYRVPELATQDFPRTVRRGGRA